MLRKVLTPAPPLLGFGLCDALWEDRFGGTSRSYLLRA